MKKNENGMMRKPKIKIAVARLALWMGAMLFFLLVHGVSHAQDEGEESRKKARISLDYVNVNNASPRLLAAVKTRVDRAYENVSGVKVNFYFREIADENLLGSAETKGNGEAEFMIPETMNAVLDTLNPVTYYAAVENDPSYELASRDIEVWQSFTEMELIEEDSMRIVRFFVGASDSTGDITGEEGVGARIFVERLFGMLPVSEDFESTDEDGYLEVEFPTDLPGDEKGEVTIVAQVSGHDRYGTLKTVKTANWGIPVVIDEESNVGQLWSSRANAPVYLMVLVNGLILGIWGTIFYVIYQIVRIGRMGRKEVSL